MTKADHIKALIRSHADGDDERFYAIAMQVAANAARAGKTNFAQELRALVDAVKPAQRRPARGPGPVPLARPRGDLAAILTAGYPDVRLHDMALEPELAARLHRVLHEQRKRTTLEQHGLTPMRKLLLVGPPGTGKTMTAAALAGELQVPLFTIQLDGLITKFLGETAAKLRLVFEAMAETRGVYLFDEFDALGGERGHRQDVGEIRRVLNSFLQFLEMDRSDSLIVGATNHVALLDQALFRRFDAVIAYAPPTDEVAARLMKDRLALLDSHGVDFSAAVKAASGLSHAEIVRACEQAAKDALLDDTTRISTDGLLRALAERHTPARAG